MTYSEKLKDPRWKERRIAYYKSFKTKNNTDKLCCEWCLTEDVKLHLHHIVYKKDHEPWEYDDYNLVLLCPECHETAHEYMDELNDILPHIMSSENKAMAFMNVANFIKLVNDFGAGQVVRALDILTNVNDIGFGSEWSTSEWLINKKQLD